MKFTNKNDSVTPCPLLRVQFAVLYTNVVERRHKPAVL